MTKLFVIFILISLQTTAQNDKYLNFIQKVQLSHYNDSVMTSTCDTTKNLPIRKQLKRLALVIRRRGCLI